MAGALFRVSERTRSLVSQRMSGTKHSTRYVLIGIIACDSKSLQAITNYYRYYLPPIAGGTGKTAALTKKEAKKELEAPGNKPSDVLWYLKAHTAEWRPQYPAFQAEEELRIGHSLRATQHSSAQRRLAKKILETKGKAWLAQMREDRDLAFERLSAPYNAELAARTVLRPTAEQYSL